jgi:ATP/maltotriose-dependent transcriptional regulator MalT/DNA-binding SARP family transcriptional activator
VYNQGVTHDPDTVLTRRVLTARVLATRLIPPRPPRLTLPRPRLTRRLLEALDYRVTTVQAGAGYGKSTALAALASADTPPLVAWYQLDREDSEPLRFLTHLIESCLRALPALSQAPLALLESRSQATTADWTPIVDALINALATEGPPLLLVLDDAHHLNAVPETRTLLDRLIRHAPDRLHLLLTTRYPLSLESLPALRVQGHHLAIGRSELAFTAEEVAALFHDCYRHPLQPDQAHLLADALEGWPIAMPLVRSCLADQPDGSVRAALDQLAGAGGDLFTFLAREVLERLPADVRHFLMATAVLTHLSVPLCDRLRQADDSARLLHFLEENGLFVTRMGEQWRYHPLFRDLLLQQLSADQRQAWQLQAAEVCQALGQSAEAIAHYLAADSAERALPLITALGRHYVAAGQLDLLAGWLACLTPAQLTATPDLLIFLGDIARLRSRFDQALGWYEQAESRFRALADRGGLGQALRGRARVYLDTVNPSQAEQLLLEALRLSDGQDDREGQARLLDLLAENLLNQGRMQAAEARRAEARALREEGPGESELPIRLWLRTGRLEEARRELDRRIAREAVAPVLQPRAHRETLLVRAIIAALQGQSADAHRFAREGTRRGIDLGSPFITAVGYSRQGEAWLLDKNEAGRVRAATLFQQTIEAGELLQVPRLKVEAHWGLCQAYGFRGELDRARESAETGLSIARQAGDEWICGCIHATMGAACTLAQQAESAAAWLHAAAASFQECGDTHGLAAVRLWQALLWQQTGDEARLRRDLRELLLLVRDHGYTWLFTERTLMGPPEPRTLVPLLLQGRHDPLVAPVAQALLEQLNLGRLTLHPGYQVRVQTLGAFRLWHDRRELPGKAWQRQKARQLFQLLVSHSRHLLHREQIIETLWPDLTPDEAQRDFKIAYNALCTVLEPQRARHAPSALIVRDGSCYGVRPEADIQCDAWLFDELVTAGDQAAGQDAPAAMALYRQALALYQGEYLQEYPYEAWIMPERRRLAHRHVRAAERLARLLAEAGAWEESADVARTLLQHDPCWEPAWQTVIQATLAQGNHAAALRAWHDCADTLQRELGVEPSAATRALLE